MSHTSPFKQSSARNRRKLAAAIEGLESRSYLSGVVFGSPINAVPAGGISPVYVNLDQLYNLPTAQNVPADLIVANSGGTLTILQGTGSGTFNNPTPITLGFTPLTIRTGVLLSNGETGIVVGSHSDDQVGVITQNTSHQFTYATPLVATGLFNTQSVALGDFNGDGLQDIAVASDDPGTSNNVAIFINQGNGVFSAPQILSVPHSNVASITAFKAGANLYDLAVADSNDNDVTVLNNNGSGTFTVGQDIPLGSGNTDPVTITDGQFDKANNNDTNDDLVTANATSGTVSVLLGNGDGTFSSVKTTAVGNVNPGGGPLKVRVSNLNADGLPDLICLLNLGTNGADAEVLLGNGDGTFHVGNLITTGSQHTQTGIAAGDLDGDGLTDMVLADSTAVTSLINVTDQDTTPPTASLATTNPTVITGAATIQFSVTYTDAKQVDTSTLKGANLTVTGPSGNAETVSLVSTNLAPAASVTVTYSIPALSGAASTADNGAYTVATTGTSANAVLNANGLPVAGTSLGQFTVSVPVVTPNGPNLVASVTARNPATAVAGTRFAGATRVTVLNSGTALAKGKIVIDLFSSTSETISGANLLEAVSRNINLKPGKSTPIVLPGFKWTAGIAGSFFLVADVNATGTISESSYADNLGISAKATAVALPFVEIDNLWSGKLPATLKVGRRTPLAVALKNLGNTLARNTAAYTVQAEDASDNLTTIGTGTVRVVAAAQGRTAVSIPVTVPSSLASGTYHIVITVSYPGDTNAGDDSATSSNTFTV